MTPYRKHYERWRNGCGSDQCPTAGGWHKGKLVCLVRGVLPCQVLFVAEAPGKNESALGAPLIGPAGKLLDRIVLEAFYERLRCAYTNIVGCMPLDPGDMTKLEEPGYEQITHCRPRLAELITIARPTLLVAVGKLAESYFAEALPKSTHLNTDESIQEHPTLKRWVNITHPAAILRATLAQQGLMVRRCVVTLATAAEEAKLL